MARPTATVSRRAKQRAENGHDSIRNRKVRPPKTAMTGLWVILMVLFFVEALFYVWCRAQCVNAGYGIDRELRRRQALLKGRSTLNIELARLKSPERIESIAQTRLGLGMPNAKQTVVLP